MSTPTGADAPLTDAQIAALRRLVAILRKDDPTNLEWPLFDAALRELQQRRAQAVPSQTVSRQQIVDWVRAALVSAFNAGAGEDNIASESVQQFRGDVVRDCMDAFEHLLDTQAQPVSARPDVEALLAWLDETTWSARSQPYVDAIRAILARVPAPAVSVDLPDLLHRFDEWKKSTEYMRTTTRPMDAGEQMAQRDAHALMLEMVAALQRAREEGAGR